MSVYPTAGWAATGGMDTTQRAEGQAPTAKTIWVDDRDGGLVLQCRDGLEAAIREARVEARDMVAREMRRLLRELGSDNTAHDRTLQVELRLRRYEGAESAESVWLATVFATAHYRLAAGVIATTTDVLRRGDSAPRKEVTL